ncbi:MAG TPA: hypothetical protein VF398_06675 [bacterium]|jgi:hypothetical protein
MSNTSAITIVGSMILLINVPFGYWRAGVRKFSAPWFLAVHLPVPVAVGLRLMVHLGWRFYLLPLWIGAFFAGQFLGGRLRSIV